MDGDDDDDRDDRDDHVYRILRVCFIFVIISVNRYAPGTKKSDFQGISTPLLPGDV